MTMKQETTEKIRRHVEEQTAKDHTRERRVSERRYRKFQKVAERPVLPVYRVLCLTGMIGGALLMASGDLVNYFRYRAFPDAGHFLRNAVISAFWAWTVFAVMLIFVCALQLKKGFSDPWFEKTSLKRNGTKKIPPEKRYRRDILIAAAGMIALGITALVVRP